MLKPVATDIESLKILDERLRWLSAWTIHHANHIRAHDDGLKVGGHQASCASMTAIMAALYFHALGPNDRVAVKPHAGPLLHAIHYLLGGQSREQLENFRGFGGAQSYPSRTKDRIPVDFSTGFYFHREGPGLLIGMADRKQRPGFDAPTDPSWLEHVTEVAARRAPTFLEMGIAHGWKGYYEVSPDHNALVGEAASVSRFLYATGFSGHGFLQGPAMGEILRDLVLGREPFVDVTPLSVERFAEGAARPERNVI